MISRFDVAAMVACLTLVTGCSEEGAGTAEQTGGTSPQVAAAASAGTAPAPQPVATPDPHAAANPAAARAADPHAGLNLPAATGSDPHAGLQMPAAPRNVVATNEGLVMSVLHGGGYSYLDVEHAGRRVWIAAGKLDVARGETVRWGDAAVMRNFHSKSLNRTFDELLFVAEVVRTAAAQPAAPAGPRGKVVSVAAGGGYSYIEVETDGGRRWLAAPLQAVKTGDTVSWSGGATMQNFNSKALNRTFAEILFVPGVSVVN